MTLAELDALGDAPNVGGVHFFIQCSRDEAILARKPYLLYAANPDSRTSVRMVSSPTSRSRAPAGQGWGTTSRSFEQVRRDVSDAVAAWPSEIRVVHDDKVELEIQFIRPATQ